ncbi:DUF4360 domain-containing protein [Actinomadura sp. 9N215]|uniref:DUF4360 domain-containing protein n=1 Tax=Actinomadura sp. 9N215 TaxID=3375150 RepID=UPI0037A072E2
MRKRIAVSAAGGAALAVLAAGAAVPAAASGPRPVRGPDGVAFEVVRSNGAGCLPGTAAVDLSDDAESFTVDYGDHTAQAGGASEPADARSLCQITLKAHLPEGFTYAISQTDYRAHANLQSGAKAVLKATYFFQAGWPPKITTLDLAGPYDEKFQITERIPADQIVWKPCGSERDLTLHSDLRVDKGTSDPAKASFLSMNSAGGGKTTYHLVWKFCN